MNSTDALHNIILGRFDNDLPRLAQAIHDRQKELRDKQAKLTMVNLQAGDRVRFRNTVSPAYLAGAEGTIVGLKQKRVSMKLDRPVGRFMGTLTTSATLIEKL